MAMFKCGGGICRNHLILRYFRSHFDRLNERLRPSKKKIDKESRFVI